MHDHVVHELVRYLSHHDLIDLDLGHLAEVVEPDELDDVSGSRAPAPVQQHVRVRIQVHHLPKVLIADADNYDGDRQIRQLDDAVLRLRQVMDAAVREQAQHVKLLVLLKYIHLVPDRLFKPYKDARKVGRPGERRIIHSSMIDAQHSEDSFHLFLLSLFAVKLSCQVPAFVDIMIFLNVKITGYSAKTVHSELALERVFLKDISYFIHGFFVLVHLALTFSILPVLRAMVSYRTITLSKVNSDRAIKHPATAHILE